MAIIRGSVFLGMQYFGQQFFQRDDFPGGLIFHFGCQLSEWQSVWVAVFLTPYIVACMHCAEILFLSADVIMLKIAYERSPEGNYVVTNMEQPPIKVNIYSTCSCHCTFASRYSE